MNQERLMQVLLAPEIKSAVELLFKVEVDAVRVVNRKGKSKRTKYGQGRRNNVRIAYVGLKKGQEIRFDEEVK